VSTALINKAVALDRLGREEEALGDYDDVIQRVGDTDDPELLELLAWAMYNKSAALHKLERTEELLGVLREIVDRFDAVEEPDLRELWSSRRQ
jgi:tetratricopeptide (TPR) repeat protein